MIYTKNYIDLDNPSYLRDVVVSIYDGLKDLPDAHNRFTETDLATIEAIRDRKEEHDEQMEYKPEKTYK